MPSTCYTIRFLRSVDRLDVEHTMHVIAPNALIAFALFRHRMGPVVRRGATIICEAAVAVTFRVVGERAADTLLFRVAFLLHGSDLVRHENVLAPNIELAQLAFADWRQDAEIVGARMHLKPDIICTVSL